MPAWASKQTSCFLLPNPLTTFKTPTTFSHDFFAASSEDNPRQGIKKTIDN
jgi:hypothetical protein